MSTEGRFFPFADRQHDSALPGLSSIDPNLSRSHYFDGRLLKAADLTRDQQYLDQRLREVGRALGSGIGHGLACDLSPRGVLSVQPGLAVATSGRVLELPGPEPLRINLYDKALIASLNPERDGRLPRGLYAVTLQFASVGTDSAEVYPRDLAGERRFHFNSWSEGVEVSLTPLRQQLPLASPVPQKARLDPGWSIAARSALAPALLANPAQPPELAEDAVALALLAIEHGQPAWLDNGLLRRPLRPPLSPFAFGQDLHAHYQELLSDVLAARRSAARNDDFPAAQYFRLLPPWGELPKDAVDPVQAVQRYFPDGYDVQIAPLRDDDLPAILAEAARLDPIDLETEQDAQIMLLAPLSDTQFATRARQLQHAPSGTAHSGLLHLDPLALRLSRFALPRQPSTDDAIWRGLWNEVDRLIYVRRPPRVAETGVSAVMLARGYRLEQASETEGTPSTDDSEGLGERNSELEALVVEQRRQIREQAATIERLQQQLSEEQDSSSAQARQQIQQLQQQLAEAREQLTLLEQLRQQNRQLMQQLRQAQAQIELLRDSGGGRQTTDISTLLRLRQVDDQKAVRAANKISERLASKPAQLQQVGLVTSLVDSRYDSVLWPTLEQLVATGQVDAFIELLAKRPAGQSLGKLVMENADSLGIPARTASDWPKLEEQLQEPRG